MENLSFPLKKSGSYLRATRLAPGTVGAKSRTNRALANQISAPLSSCVLSLRPSVPNSSQFSSASKVSGTDAVYGGLLELIPFPPVSSVLEEIEFGRKPLFESGCFLTAAPPNRGLLKQAKVKDMNHRQRGTGHQLPIIRQRAPRGRWSLSTHIGTAGPFPASLGGSRYIVMFVDSASRLLRPHGTRNKSAAAILAVVKRFIAGMGVPRTFRSDN